MYFFLKLTKRIKTYASYVFVFTMVAMVVRRRVREMDELGQHGETETRQLEEDTYEQRMKRVEAVQEERQRRMRETCEALGYSRVAPPADEAELKAVKPLIVYEPYKTMICLMAKVASTGWKVELALLSNKTGVNRKYLSHTNTSFWFRVYDKELLKTYGIHPPSDYSKDDQLYRIRNYYSFIFSRHPLERQVSAYRNKLEFANLQAYNAFYSLVRGKRPDHFNGTSDISFKEFITYVVRRLNSGKGINEHLDTYQHLCNPCVLNYKFIGDMATMKDDVAYVINKMTNRKYTESMFSQNAPEKTHESEKVYLKYYKDLGTELVNEIDKAFDVDCRLFGYKTLSALLKEES